MTKTTKGTTSLTKLVTVPIGWATYEIDYDDIGVLSDEGVFSPEYPIASIMEALVVMGKAKRLATIHSINVMAGDEDDSDDESSLFGEERT